MTRKPDEIKKGLECCVEATSDCSACPYHKEGDGDCVDILKRDAFALIQRLQDDNAQLNRCIENMTDKLNAMNDEVAKLQADCERHRQSAIKCCYESRCSKEIKELDALCHRLMDEKEQLQAERDAAVALIPRACAYCKWYGTKHGGFHPDCKSPNGCRNINGINTGWEWRGVQKEE